MTTTQQDAREAAIAHAEACRYAFKRGKPRPRYEGPGLCVAELRLADLNYANFRDVDLGYADLSGASLICADLTDADLRGSDLSGADLRCSNLSNTDLRESDLVGALLCGSTIDGAILLSESIGGPGHILCALTDAEWEMVRQGREASNDKGAKA